MKHYGVVISGGIQSGISLAFRCIELNLGGVPSGSSRYQACW
jgi:hypothetical protein